MNQYKKEYYAIQTNTIEIPVDQVKDIKVSDNYTFIIKTDNYQITTNKIEIKISSTIYDRIKRIYYGMISRCLSEKNPSYLRYGKKGVSICDEWIESFDAFLNWSLLNGYDNSLTIDRISNDKGYSPSNCRWATRKQQSNNQTSNHLIEYKEEYKTLSEWADEFNIPYLTLRTRIYNLHWNIEKALTTPIKKTTRKSNRGTIIYNGKKYYKSEFCELFNINPNTLRSQLRRGWTAEEIVNKARSKKTNKHINGE